MTERVLLVRRGGLGDTLLMAPVLRALARAHPGAAIDFAGNSEFGAVLAHWGLAARVFSSEDCQRSRWGSDGAGSPGERWRRYRAILSDDPAFEALARPTCQVACFDPRPRDAQPLPLQIARQVGLALLWPQDARCGTWRPEPGGAVVLAPGSGGRAKCWPSVRWLELAAGLAAFGRVAVVVGPVEVERDDPRTWPWPVPVSFLVHEAVVVLGGDLARAQAFVGNDSGTTHLAAMTGLPTVALFGPSDPAVFAPNGPRVEVVRAPGSDLAALPTGTVLAACRRQLTAPGVAPDQGNRARTRSQ